ncbi:MAG: hypothetical protein IJ083_10350 [Clostridia bacterium]|nr:hypothetical protein [Clostridia bacterium]
MEHQTAKLRVTLEKELVDKIEGTEKIELLSNIRGDLVLSGEVLVSEDKSVPDGKEVDLAFGQAYDSKPYRNPGTAKVKKQANAIQTDSVNGGSYIDYTVTVTAQDIMKSPVTLTDTLNEYTAFRAPYTASFTLTDKVNGTTKEVDLSSSHDGFALTVAEDHFSLTLPEMGGKLEEHTYTLKYRVYLKDTLNFPSDREYIEIKNTAYLKYTDDNGRPKEYEGTETVKAYKPKLVKTGRFVSVQSDDTYQPVLSDYSFGGQNNSYNGTRLYYYPVLFTLSLDANDMDSVLNETTPILLKDTMGKLDENGVPIKDYYKDVDWLIYGAAGPNAVRSHYANQSFNVNNLLGDGYKGDPLYGYNSKQNPSASLISEEQLEKAAKNTRVLFQMGLPEQNPGISDGVTLTLDQFEKNGSVYT